MTESKRIETQQEKRTRENKKKLKKMQDKWEAGLQKLLDKCPEMSESPVKYPDIDEGGMDCMSMLDFPHWPSCSKNSYSAYPEGIWRKQLENCTPNED